MVAITNSWLNSDALFIKYGVSEGVSPNQGGFVCTSGPYLTYVLDLDLTALDQNEVIQNDVLTIPKDALIVSVQTIACVGAATGTAIDVGLIAHTRITTTDLNASVADADPDGLLAAAPTANMNSDGEISTYTVAATIPLSLTGTGALIGKIMTVPTLITASRTDGTAFTAGKIKLLVNVLPNATTGFGLMSGHA